MTRRISVRACVIALCVCEIVAATASARVGMGDPVEPWREKKPDQLFLLHGHLRLRPALYQNLDLDRGPSSDGSFLWPAGATDLDLTTGGDLRLRISPSIFLSDEARVFVEIDVLDNVALGARPRFTPFEGRTGIVAGTPFQEPLTALDGAFAVRTAMGEVLTPFGVLSAGRMPSHFGLGIGANAGDSIDDDLGDRADRVAFVAPLFGHYVAAALDVGASGPAGPSAFGGGAGLGPLPRNPLVSEQAISLALLKFRAPWEVEAYRKEGYVVVDYGLATAIEWQVNDVPGFYQDFDAELGLDPDAVVYRGYTGGVADGWLRIVSGMFRFEAEAIVTAFHYDNASPFAGVLLRQPVEGLPWGFAAVLELKPDPQWSVLTEIGAASADDAPGFPLAAPTTLSGARQGDVFGPQLDGTKDSRLDSFRLHPLHKVDLILWRTLLGGVSEAAFARAQTTFAPAKGITFEGNAIYSHALSAVSAPGGVNPLGIEVDAAATVETGGFSLRADVGLLLPLGGLGTRAPTLPATPATMALLRFGYAF
ncbi:MAG: hypothetical protein Q8O67_06020 [Deltaproteobacteria bacterium]|nr:hypothetical protein [Deltaproteobacteria bacterium]